MSRKARRIGLSLVLLALTAVVVGSAAAAGTSGIRVSGTYTVPEIESVECTPIDDVRLRCNIAGVKSEYDGSLDGSSVGSLETTIDCSAGLTWGHGSETFTGSVGSRKRTGTLTWRLALVGRFDCELFAPYDLRIVGVVTDGTGKLADLRGVITFDDTTYKGKLR